MSTFEVKVREIDKIEPHPNADKLELVVIGGYKAVVQKGIHTAGDKILYVPEDTVFKNLETAEKLGIGGYLMGKNKNRVKAIKLRGVLSQGIVLPLSAFDGVIPIRMDGTETGFYWKPAFRIEDTSNEWAVASSDDIIDILELEKYEEPIPIEMAGQVRKWPSFVPKYDVENLKRPESMAAMVEGEEVVFTEKLHGTNMTVAWGPGLEDGETVFVCSHNNALKENDTNVYWRATRTVDLDSRIAQMKEYFESKGTVVDTLSIHGEVVGVQDLKYGCTAGAVAFYIFDIMLNGQFLDYDQLREVSKMHGIRPVPELYRGPYSYDVIAAHAHGKTTVGDDSCDHIREGGVVKPVKERTDIVAGRVNFKYVSDDYLTRKTKDATEYH